MKFVTSINKHIYFFADSKLGQCGKCSNGKWNFFPQQIAGTNIFMKIKFPHRESNPGRLRERQES